MSASYPVIDLNEWAHNQIITFTHRLDGRTKEPYWNVALNGHQVMSRAYKPVRVSDAQKQAIEAGDYAIPELALALVEGYEQACEEFETMLQAREDDYGN